MRGRGVAPAPIITHKDYPTWPGSVPLETKHWVSSDLSKQTYSPSRVKHLPSVPEAVVSVQSALTKFTEPRIIKRNEALIIDFI